jgi:hypothetical protein
MSQESAEFTEGRSPHEADNSRDGYVCNDDVDGCPLGRVIFVAMTLLAMLVLATYAAWAGSPHFVGQRNSHDDSLEVFGKDAGLGDETDVNIKVTATALCINGDGHHPKAVNKEFVSAEQSMPSRTARLSSISL